MDANDPLCPFGAPCLVRGVPSAGDVVAVLVPAEPQVFAFGPALFVARRTVPTATYTVDLPTVQDWPGGQSAALAGAAARSQGKENYGSGTYLVFGIVAPEKMIPLRGLAPPRKNDGASRRPTGRHPASRKRAGVLGNPK